MRTRDTWVTQQSMKRAHKVRKFRRSNEEHGARAYLARKAKPWRQANNLDDVPVGRVA